MLDVVQRADGGSFYPHVADREDQEYFRFFAGRLAGVKPSSELPVGHPVSKGTAEDWSFSGDEIGGSWISAKFDRQNDILSVASDIFLLQRWYYATQGGKWYFSNSIIFINEIAAKSFEIDERAVPYMLLFGYLPNRYTPLKGVYSVRPGQSLTVTRSEMQIFQRSHLPLERPDSTKYAGISEEQLRTQTCNGVLNTLRESVSAELSTLDSVTIPISGGLDSRFALGCALESMPKDRILTYTYGHPNSYDLRIGTSLAKHLGLRNTPVPMDPRPLDEILEEGFLCSEGMKLTFPNYPIGPLKEVLTPGTHVLSGFLGDTMWGMEDLSESDAQFSGGGMGDFLVKLVMSRALHVPIADVRKVLTTDDWDSLGYRDTIRNLPGETIDERYSRWYAEDRDTNRISFAVQMHRNRAFFLAPHVHAKVVKFAHSMPVTLRRNGVAYRSAMKMGFPDLYNFPTTRNFGYPPGVNVKWRQRITRRWWSVVSEFEKKSFRYTGKLFFYPPLGRQYAHPLELQKERHRSAVLRCLDELEPMSVLDKGSVSRLRDDYFSRRPHPPQLLRSLITIRMWQKYFRGK